jgi:hypothetical protein
MPRSPVAAAYREVGAWLEAHPATARDNGRASVFVQGKDAIHV